ncbi:hypothetical protein AC579_9046 [Pseudocercospora musae]|uniref:Uncharacterized protein n=1 Tax=Pseudocercospora musae TaxID=113226 RepID=A0A139ISY2_9PEZI|nr:hypothetical protein AC579_9046 [Pseudocercospora musae]
MYAFTYLVCTLSLLNSFVTAAPAAIPGSKDDATIRHLLQSHLLVARNARPARPAVQSEHVWIDEFDNVQIIPETRPVEHDAKHPESTRPKQSHHHKAKSPFDFLVQRYSHGVEMVNFDQHYLKGFFDGITSIAIYGAMAVAASICIALIHRTIASTYGGAIRLGAHSRGFSKRYSL